MYSNKVNGHAFAGEHLTGNIQFYSITTGVDITGTTPTSAAALDKLVEVVSLNGQPIIMGAPAANGSTFVFKFAIEHTGAWANSAALVSSIQANAPQFTADASLAVAIGETL